jgi:hypothetical protein
MAGVVDDVECTAAGRTGDRPNILFTPPCSCPRCAPDPVDSDPSTADLGTIWVPVNGRPVRHSVAPAHLGQLGKSVLG